MNPSLGQIPIDVDKLLESRLLVQAGSGGGKSWALRRLIEQTAPLVQQFIVDPEGEFVSLRERFDFIICAPKGGDVVANPETADKLARALWASGCSAVLDISELPPAMRQRFVRRFFEGLIGAPRAEWHRAMVVVDEASTFAPQSGNAESGAAMVDMAARGRKRGLALVCAVQRISRLNKDVAAELQNKLTGRTVLDVDVQRAGDDLGFTRKDAVERLRNLHPGEFYAVGPALVDQVTRTKVGGVVTEHPRTGHRGHVALAAPSPKLLEQLGKLEGIHRAVNQEADDVETLRRRVRELENGISYPTPEAYDAVCRARDNWQRCAEEIYSRLRAILTEMKRDVDGVLASLPGTAREFVPDFGKANVDPYRPPGMSIPQRTIKAFSDALPPASRTTSTTALVAASIRPQQGPKGGPEQRILDALAWLESIGVPAPENAAVAFMAGYRPNGGAYNNPRGALRTKGLIEYPGDGTVRLTDTGRRVANFPVAPPSRAEVQERVLARLAGPEQRILMPLLKAYPDGMTNEDLAAAAGYSSGGGAYNNPRGRLRTLGLIEYQNGLVKARSILFP